MQSRFVDRDAQAAVDRYAKAGIARDLALRVYTTRLLGGDPKLVLHGGGNTSVKTRMPDLAGDETEVLCVKGSGADMAAIEPAGMPAVRLDALRKLRARDDIADEQMVRAAARQPDRPGRAQSFGRDAAARLRAAQVRRSHPRHRAAQPDRPAGRRKARARRLRRPRSASCPTAGPASASPRRRPKCSTPIRRSSGLILHKHGIFTFGDDAREAYERMIEMVTIAEGNG